MIIVPEELVAKREKMTIDEWHKLIRSVKAKYVQAGRKGNGQTLDTLAEATGNVVAIQSCYAGTRCRPSTSPKRHALYFNESEPRCYHE